MLDFQTNIRCSGLTITGGGLTGLLSSDLPQSTSQKIALPISGWRVSDNFQTVLPNPSATTILGVYTGVYGTGTPYIATSDLHTAGATTRRARILALLPPEYVTGGGVSIAFSAGMLTTISDTTATIIAEAYKTSRDTLKMGSNLVITSATSINSLTFGSKEFICTPDSLAAGDTLDIRMSITVNDGGTGTAVVAAVANAELWLTIR